LLMLDTLKMWVIGLPYALYQTQRVKVGVDRFMRRVRSLPEETGWHEWNNIPTYFEDWPVITLCDYPGWNIEPGDDHTWN